MSLRWKQLHGVFLEEMRACELMLIIAYSVHNLCRSACVLLCTWKEILHACLILHFAGMVDYMRRCTLSNPQICEYFSIITYSTVYVYPCILTCQPVCVQWMCVLVWIFSAFSVCIAACILCICVSVCFDMCLLGGHLNNQRRPSEPNRKPEGVFAHPVEVWLWGWGGQFV